MKKILFMSDGYSLQTGYGGVARHISSYLASTGKYEIAYLSWFFNHGMREKFGAPPFTEFTTFKDHNNCCKRGKVIEKYTTDNKVEYFRVEGNIAMLPISSNIPACKNDNVIQSDKYGYESMPSVIQHYKPDIVWTLGDIWMHYHTSMMPHRNCFKWLCYNPIDSAPTPHITTQGNQVINWPKILSNPDELVMFCNFGIDSLNKTSEKYGYGKLADKYIWHGTDLSVFKPLSDDIKKQLRKKIFNFGDEVFLVGFFSRNQPRKALHKVFEAVRKFKDKGYETGKKLMVYFHAPIKDLGWNLEGLTTWYDLQDTVILNKDLQIGGGVPEDTLNKLYNICDITTLPSRGEGWGLTVSDSICAGVPCLTSDYSAHADWTKNSGTTMYIKTAALDAEPITNQERAIVDTDDYADKLKQMYDSPELLKTMKESCLNFRQELSWTKITKQWEDLIDTIDVNKKDSYREIIYKPKEYNVSNIPSDPINISFNLTEI